MRIIEIGMLLKSDLSKPARSGHDAEIHQFIMYQTRTVNIKQGSFFRYRFLSSGLALFAIY
ncbi:MAG: hypothetical protein SRB2_01915 [Desulfobacteraceae bacterium Eth-SRB2]|nr:MAG: hypothetical protein SRB2_01915 [Desulfobacteraceae bacterium Eth-SRB2]